MSDSLLMVRNLTVEIRGRRGTVRPVEDLTLDLTAGEILGLVGESGSGKSMTLRAILGVLPSRARIVGGQVWLKGRDLTGLNRSDMRAIQGREISMVFQEPMTALNPVMRVGHQVAEPLRVHLGYDKSRAFDRTADLLRKVGIADVERRMAAYPHELSGGMRQRVMIAMALACEPDLILCDEPTTALDVTIQDQILKLLRDLALSSGASLVFVTHDLPVVAQMCQRLAVMYAAKIVETGPVGDLLREPRHPYTWGLRRSVPDLAKVAESLEAIPGRPPDLTSPPSGCRFHPRCPMAKDDCDNGEFPLLDTAPDRLSACRYHYETHMLMSQKDPVRG